VPPDKHRVNKRALLPIIVPTLLALLGGLGSIFVAGATVGMFLLSFTVAAILTPSAAHLAGQFSGSIAITWRARLVALAGVCDGLAGSWLWLVADGSISFRQWLACSLVLIGFVAMLGAVASVEWRRVRGTKTAESHVSTASKNVTLGQSSAILCGIVMLIGLAELTWPVWLSPQFERMDKSTIFRLIDLHPVFAINGVLPQMDAWPHQRLAYRLTSLGQDVPFALPQTIWPSVLGHLAVGSTCVGLTMIVRRARRGSR